MGEFAVRKWTYGPKILTVMHGGKVTTVTNIAIVKLLLLSYTHDHHLPSVTVKDSNKIEYMFLFDDYETARKMYYDAVEACKDVR